MDEHCPIRPGRLADAAALARLERECFSDPWSEEAFAEALTGEGMLSLVAQVDGPHGEPVGYLVARQVLESAEVLNLAVSPARRGAGVGGRLLQAALTHLARTGVTEVFLEVRESNAAALRLYQGRGFRAVGRRRGYYRHPEEDALVLRCRLPGSA